MPRERDEPVRLTRIYTPRWRPRRDVARRRHARLEARRADRRVRDRRRAELPPGRRARRRLSAVSSAPTLARLQNELFDRRRRPLASRSSGGAPADRASRSRSARSRVRPVQRGAAAADELRLPGGTSRPPRRCTSPAPCAAEPSGGRSPRRLEHDVNPLAARLPQPPLRPAFHPRPHGERVRGSRRAALAPGRRASDGAYDTSSATAGQLCSSHSVSSSADVGGAAM